MFARSFLLYSGTFLDSAWHSTLYAFLGEQALACMKHCHHPWPVCGLLQVFAIDTVPERLELAREFGATPLSLAAPAPCTAAGARTAERGDRGSTVPAEAAEAPNSAASSKGAPEPLATGTLTPEDSHTAGGCGAGSSNGAEVNVGLPAPVDRRAGSGGCSGAHAVAREGTPGAGAGALGATERAASAASPTGPAAEQQWPGGARGTASSNGTGACAALPKEGGPGDPSSSAAGSPGGAAGVLAAVRRATGGRGADVLLEAVGSQAAVRLAYELIRPGGAAPVLPSTCCSCVSQGFSCVMLSCTARRPCACPRWSNWM